MAAGRSGLTFATGMRGREAAAVPSLLQLCVGEVGRYLPHLLRMDMDAHEFNLRGFVALLPPHARLALTAIARRRGLLFDWLLEALVDDTWHSVDLCGSDVSDQGLCHVAQTCPNLVALDIRECNAVSLHGLTLLLKACPALQLLRMGLLPIPSFRVPQFITSPFHPPFPRLPFPLSPIPSFCSRLFPVSPPPLLPFSPCLLRPPIPLPLFLLRGSPACNKVARAAVKWMLPQHPVRGTEGAESAEAGEEEVEGEGETAQGEREGGEGGWEGSWEEVEERLEERVPALRWLIWCPLRGSPAWVPCVCPLRGSPAWVPCVCPLRGSPACAPCVCPLRGSPACTPCVGPLRVPLACAPCVGPLRVPLAAPSDCFHLHPLTPMLSTHHSTPIHRLPPPLPVTRTSSLSPLLPMQPALPLSADSQRAFALPLCPSQPHSPAISLSHSLPSPPPAHRPSQPDADPNSAALLASKCPRILLNPAPPSPPPPHSLPPPYCHIPTTLPSSDPSIPPNLPTSIPALPSALLSRIPLQAFPALPLDTPHLVGIPPAVWERGAGEDEEEGEGEEDGEEGIRGEAEARGRRRGLAMGGAQAKVKSGTEVPQEVHQEPEAPQLSIAERFRLAFVARDERLAPKRAKNQRQRERREGRDRAAADVALRARLLASAASRSLRLPASGLKGASLAFGTAITGVTLFQPLQARLLASAASHARLLASAASLPIVVADRGRMCGIES
ncbi:unnamed protein product [Closterium sp. Naga37s-1]|nr:unnamed protein product [Closterium sp. Naga37s-1]